MNQIVLLAVVVAVLALFIARHLATRPKMSATAAHQALQQGTAVLIDVREADEWTNGVAAPAVLLPLSDLRGPRTGWKAFLEKNRDKQLLVYCRSGMRSASAVAHLRREGFDAINIGSLSTWTGAGLPTRRADAT